MIGSWEDCELCVLTLSETSSYNPFDDRFPESPNIAVSKLPPEVILILLICFDGVHTQLLSRGEGWRVVNTQYRLHSDAEPGLELFALRRAELG